MRKNFKKCQKYFFIVCQKEKIKNQFEILQQELFVLSSEFI